MTWSNRHDGLELPKRPVWKSLARGFRCRCPRCGDGAVFNGYLKVRDACTACGEELHHHRADDAPPYFTILILGHVIVSLVLVVESSLRPPLWVHMALWLPLTLVGSLALLRPIKAPCCVCRMPPLTLTAPWDAVL